MCYFPLTRMACGHQEMSRIPLRYPTAAIFASLHTHSEEPATNETHICRNICQSFEDVGAQEIEMRSGEMCGPCQVDTGKILDKLVRAVDGTQANDDQQWMMSGGLDGNAIDIYLENPLDYLVRDVNGVEASNEQPEMISDGLDADIINAYPETALDEFAYSAGWYPMNDASLDIYTMSTMSDGFARDESIRTYEDKVTEWSSKKDSYEEVAGCQSKGDFLRSLLKPGHIGCTTECSNCKHFKRRGTMFNFQDHVSPVSTIAPSAPSYMGRSCPILAKLRSDVHVQDEEGGLLGRFGRVCCEKCGAQMHLL